MHLEVGSIVLLCYRDSLELSRFHVKFIRIVQRTFIVCSAVDQRLVSHLDEAVGVPSLWDDETILKILHLLHLIRLLIEYEQIVEDLILHDVLASEDVSLAVPRCGSDAMTSREPVELHHVQFGSCH